MPSSPHPVSPSGAGIEDPPDPGQAATLDDLVERLRLLKVWAGDLSYERIMDRINTAWSAAGRPATELARKTTVVDCFRPGRRRLNIDLVVAVVQALHPDVGYMAQWRQSLRVVGAETQAASQVRVQNSLPEDLREFTGRGFEVEELCQAMHKTRRDGGTMVISAIEGMAGVGKTQLAVHAAHVLVRQHAFDKVLFVNLRGFHPDSAQPPADPAAVLDGFLRLLGVPGHQIPHDLDARSNVYRARLAGTNTLIVLDNAAGTEQVRPLLPATPGCLTLITSRRSLTDLQPTTILTVDVFTPDEAIAFLSRAEPDVAVGLDPHAAARIAHRCGYLPLALSLVAGHIRATPGWTLTDHADRLDERHHHRQLDSGVALAFDLSYQHLPADQQRLLRLAALHPGQDLDAHAAAALTGTDLPTARDHLHHLCCREHLLQQPTPGRSSFHDLLRAYAAGLASDQDAPPQRRAALTRLFDYYLAAAATAMDVAYPLEQQRRPAVPPAGTPIPDLSDRDRADRWLDTELPNLLSTAQHAAEYGWPEHAWQLSAVLDRHLRTRGRYRDAETLHEQALHLARHHGNHAAEVNALNGLGYVHRLLGGYEQAIDHFGRGLEIAQATGNRGGELHALTGFGHVHWMQGRYELAAGHLARALQIAQDTGDRSGEREALAGLAETHRMLALHEQAADDYERARQISHDIGDRAGEVQALNGLGNVHRVMGRYELAAEHHRQALRSARETGHRSGELAALTGLGETHRSLGDIEQAADHYRQGWQIAKDTGDPIGELNALNGLASLHRTLGRHSEAAGYYQQVFDLARQLGSKNWQFEALQGQGRLHHAGGNPDLALNHHEQALQLATELAQPTDQARAHDGLAHAHHAKGNNDQARVHWQHALAILTSIGTEHTDEIETSVPNIRAQLTSLEI